MSCRSSDLEQSFPPYFSLDTDSFLVAMAEHNWNRTRAGFPRVSFLELERDEQHHVLSRAQEFKDSPQTAWRFIPTAPPPEQPAPEPEPDPWPVVAFAWCAERFESLVASMRRAWWF